MERIARLFIDNKRLSIVLTLFLCVWGSLSLLNIKSESRPSVNLATATIVTNYEGASAEDIEAKITTPLEDEIREVLGVKDVSSISKSGLSFITVRVDMDNYDADQVMDELEKAVENASDLPSDLIDEPEFERLNSAEFPVYELAILGPNDQRQRDATAEALEEYLEEIKAVKEVNLKGFAKRQFNVHLNHERLQHWNVGIADILSAIENRSVNVPGGKLDDGRTETLLRVEGKVRKADELGDIVIRANFTGRPIFLRDLTTRIEDSKEDLRVLTTFNGQNATTLSVVKKAGEDAIAMVRDIEARLEMFKQTMTPEGIEIVSYKNEADEVEKRLEILKSNAVSGLLLVILFLFLFLPFKVGIAASISLPLSVLGTLGVMSLLGMNLNSITVLALIISLGMLVDNSVVISENYEVLLSKGMSAIEAAVSSVRTLWGAITASALTTIAAFLPMLVTKGVMGEFIFAIPIIVTISLLWSLIESFTLLPMRVVTFAKDLSPKKSKFDLWFAKITTHFARHLEWTLQRPYWILGGFFGVILISGLFMFQFNKFVLFPASETEEYLARFELPRGTTVEETQRQANALSQKVFDLMGGRVKNIAGTVGEQRSRPDDLRGSDGAYVGLLRIYVNDDTKYNMPHQEVLAKLRSIPVGPFQKLHFEEVLNGPPVGNAIQARFQSNDQEKLNAMVEAVKKDLERVEGVENLRVDDVFGEDEIFVDINYDFAKRLNLDVAFIGHSIRTAVAGRIASELNLNNDKVNVFLRFSEESRKDLTDLQRLKIQDRNGRLYDLKNLASFKQQSGSPQIKHYNFKRARTLVGDVKDENLNSSQVASLIRDSYNKHSQGIKGIALYQGGAAESSAESMQSLTIATVLALVAIFGLLVVILNSFATPLIVMTTIPLGLFGFSVAFWFHGRPTSFLALIGVIGLAGIIVNSGIVLISTINQMRAEHPKQNLIDLLVLASSNRLRAVVVTSLTTICGLLPTAYGIGGQDSLLIPMTLAMAWGLSTGTLLTLIWVPSAYLIVEELKLKSRMILKQHWGSMRQRLKPSSHFNGLLCALGLLACSTVSVNTHAQDSLNHQIVDAFVDFSAPDDHYLNVLRLSLRPLSTPAVPAMNFLNPNQLLDFTTKQQLLVGLSHELWRPRFGPLKSIFLSYDVGYAKDTRFLDTSFGNIKAKEMNFSLSFSPELQLYEISGNWGTLSLRTGPEFSLYILAITNAGAGVDQSHQFWVNGWQASLDYRFLKNYSVFTKYHRNLIYDSATFQKASLSGGLALLL